MKSKKMTLSFARCLLRMAEGEQLSKSEIASKSLLENFCEDSILIYRKISPRRSLYVCADMLAMHRYLNSQYEIISLYDFIQAHGIDCATGEDSLKATKSTKAFRKKSLQGFFVRSYGADVYYNGTILERSPKGIELFVHEYSELKIDEDVVVIGIENPECFTKFLRLKHLFPYSKIITVMRYHSINASKWLKLLPNKYIHFGDFDIAGILMYQNEFVKVLGEERSSFFIPENIEYLIKEYGSNNLFNEQLRQADYIDIVEDEKLCDLVEMIKDKKLALEQERLLREYK